MPIGGYTQQVPKEQNDSEQSINPHLGFEQTMSNVNNIIESLPEEQRASAYEGMAKLLSSSDFISMPESQKAASLQEIISIHEQSGISLGSCASMYLSDQVQAEQTPESRMAVIADMQSKFSSYGVDPAQLSPKVISNAYSVYQDPNAYANKKTLLVVLDEHDNRARPNAAFEQAIERGHNILLFSASSVSEVDEFIMAHEQGIEASDPQHAGNKHLNMVLTALPSEKGFAFDEETQFLFLTFREDSKKLMPNTTGKAPAQQEIGDWSRILESTYSKLILDIPFAGNEFSKQGFSIDPQYGGLEDRYTYAPKDDQVLSGFVFDDAGDIVGVQYADANKLLDAPKSIDDAIKRQIVGGELYNAEIYRPTQTQQQPVICEENNSPLITRINNSGGLLQGTVDINERSVSNFNLIGDDKTIYPGTAVFDIINYRVNNPVSGTQDGIARPTMQRGQSLSPEVRAELLAETMQISTDIMEDVLKKNLPGAQQQWMDDIINSVNQEVLYEFSNNANQMDFKTLALEKLSEKLEGCGLVHDKGSQNTANGITYDQYIRIMNSCSQVWNTVVFDVQGELTARSANPNTMHGINTRVNQGIANQVSLMTGCSTRIGFFMDWQKPADELLADLSDMSDQITNIQQEAQLAGAAVPAENLMQTVEEAAGLLADPSTEAQGRELIKNLYVGASARGKGLDESSRQIARDVIFSKRRIIANHPSTISSNTQTFGVNNITQHHDELGRLNTTLTVQIKISDHALGECTPEAFCGIIKKDLDNENNRAQGMSIDNVFYNSSQGAYYATMSHVGKVQDADDFISHSLTLSAPVQFGAKGPAVPRITVRGNRWIPDDAKEYPQLQPEEKKTYALDLNIGYQPVGEYFNSPVVTLSDKEFEEFEGCGCCMPIKAEDDLTKEELTQLEKDFFNKRFFPTLGMGITGRAADQFVWNMGQSTKNIIEATKANGISLFGSNELNADNRFSVRTNPLQGTITLGLGSPKAHSATGEQVFHSVEKSLTIFGQWSKEVVDYMSTAQSDIIDENKLSFNTALKADYLLQTSGFGGLLDVKNQQYGVDGNLSQIKYSPRTLNNSDVLFSLTANVHYEKRDYLGRDPLSYDEQYKIGKGFMDMPSENILKTKFSIENKLVFLNPSKELIDVLPHYYAGRDFASDAAAEHAPQFSGIKGVMRTDLRAGIGIENIPNEFEVMANAGAGILTSLDGVQIDDITLSVDGVLKGGINISGSYTFHPDEHLYAPGNQWNIEASKRFMLNGILKGLSINATGGLSSTSFNRLDIFNPKGPGGVSKEINPATYDEATPYLKINLKYNFK